MTGKDGKLRFYTLPPADISWPYLLVNPGNYKILFKRRFKHAILDCGVEYFTRNPKAKDYPNKFLEEWRFRARQLTEIFGDKIWITIPDYPDDLNRGQFGDNVSKTLRNIEEFISIDGVNWLISIQSKFLNRLSFLECANSIRKLVGSYPLIAIGTVCKTNKLDFIYYCCQAARKLFPKSNIHAFGLTLTALPKVKALINSWDSLAWTFTRGRRVDSEGRKMARAINKKERIRFFNNYLNRIKNVLDFDCFG